MKFKELDRLFNPRSVALIGASATPGKWGYHVLFNILKADFSGQVHAVNPKGGSVLGMECRRSLSEVPGAVDLAVITTPAPTVLNLIEECGRKGVKHAVVITSDFSETGAEGARMERELVAKARKYGMRLVGPNTMGIYSAKSNLHALLPPVMPRHGGLSMFSQSGNVGVQMLYWGNNKGVGFEKFVSSGNEGDLKCEDYLRYFADDEATRVIIAYMEGLDPDSALYPVAHAVSHKKPILIFKGGRTDTGGKAAASHSGAMACSSKVLRAAFHQAGIIEVEDSQELMDCASLLAVYPIPQGKRVGILTRGGGWGVITADACEEQGLVVPKLPDRIIDRLNKILPQFWSHGNPVDMAATLGAQPYLDCMETLAHWDGVDSIIALGGSLAEAFDVAPKGNGSKEIKDAERLMELLKGEIEKESELVVRHMRQLVADTGKPIISVSITGAEMDGSDPDQSGIVAYPTPERAVRVLKHMINYHDYLKLRKAA